MSSICCDFELYICMANSGMVVARVLLQALRQLWLDDLDLIFVFAALGCGLFVGTLGTGPCMVQAAMFLHHMLVTRNLDLAHHVQLPCWSCGVWSISCPGHLVVIRLLLVLIFGCTACTGCSGALLHDLDPHAISPFCIAMLPILLKFPLLSGTACD